MPPPPSQLRISAVNNPPSDLLLSLLLRLVSPKSRSYPRRFLKTPTMSLPPNPNPNPQFSSPESLSAWLRRRLPSDSLAAWGVSPGTKNLHNLWLELSHGETHLADSIPPVRTLHVVSVRVLAPHAPAFLVEARQELSDGSFRDRGRPLSEKMRPGEDPMQAAARAVREELGSILPGPVGDGIVRIVPESYMERVEERGSLSYPGLPARYVLHSVDAWVDGLPEGEFCTEEEGEYPDSEEARVADKAVSVRKHFWNW